MKYGPQQLELAFATLGPTLRRKVIVFMPTPFALWVGSPVSLKRGDTVSSVHDLPKINETIRILAFLINQPTKEEIKKNYLCHKQRKSWGLDGLNASFFHEFWHNNCWEIVSNDWVITALIKTYPKSV